MSDKMDQLIRLAAKKDLIPPEGLEERTMRKIEQRIQEKKRTKFQMVFRPAVALLLLAAVCLAVNPAIAKYRPIVKYFFNDYKNNKATEKNLQEFCMTIDEVKESKDLGTLSPYSKIKITPQTAISDGFATYVVIKVEGIDGFEIKDDIVLDDEGCGIGSLYSEGIKYYGLVSDCYLSDRGENALYYTMSLWGTQIPMKKELAIDIATNALVRADLDESGRALLPDRSEDTTVIDGGAYRAKICCRVSGEPNIRNFYVSREMPYGMRISPLGIQFQSMTANREKELLNAENISVILKDGRKIPLALHAASGPTDNDTQDAECVSTFDDIISNTGDIRYLVVDNQKYDLKKIEKHQK